jgi:hypothetical protein
VPVIDVDYQSGAVSEIAPDFATFLTRLYRSED